MLRLWRLQSIYLHVPLFLGPTDLCTRLLTFFPLTILFYSPLWREHHLRQWDHFLPRIPRGVPQLGWLLLADHSGSRLWYQAELHLAAGSRAAWLHHCMVWNDFSISPSLVLLGTVSCFLNLLLKIDVQICSQVRPVLLFLSETQCHFSLFPISALLFHLVTFLHL